MTTLRRQLFQSFVPLVLIPLAIVTIWNGAIGYFKGSDGAGFGWTGQAARAYPEVFDLTGELIASRLETLSASFLGGQKPIVNDDEIFFVYSLGAREITAVGNNFESLDFESMAVLEGLGSWDFHVVNKRLFFVTAADYGAKRLILLKEFDQRYLAGLQGVFGTEIALYLDFNPLITTWQTREGEFALLPMSKTAKDALLEESSSPVVQVKDTFGIKNYRGIPGGEMQDGKFVRLYGAGDSNFSTYHSILALRNRSGKLLGHLDVAVPSSAVNEGPLYGVIGSVVIFMVLAILSSLVVRRVAFKYSKPLRDAAQDAHDLMDVIAARLPNDANESGDPQRNHLPQEISFLQAAISKLQRIVQAWSEAEEQLESSRKQLVQSAKMSALGEMAGGVAHEINNPLAIIHARARHIQKILTSEPTKMDSALEFAKVIELTSERIAAIVRGLRSFSRSGETDPFELCDLKSILDDTLVLCSERFRLHDIDLRIEGPSNDTTIEGRSVQISQVLLNLLNNAYDAIETLPEKWISISFKDLGDTIRIEVMDSGTGIPAEIRDKIMQPFFTTKAIGKGTGLGLSVTRGIIAEHGGTLTIDFDCPNTRFVIDLPKKCEKSMRRGVSHAA